MKKSRIISMLTAAAMLSLNAFSITASAENTLVPNNAVNNYVVEINVAANSNIANAAITTTYNINMLEFNSILEGSAISDASTGWEGYKQYDGLVCCEYYDTTNAITSQGQIAQIRFNSAYNLDDVTNYFDVTYSYLKLADGTNVSEDYVSVNCYLMGDANLDGQVTQDDATLIGEHYVHSVTLTGNALVASDVNFDGIVNIVDATWVARHATGEVVSFW
ncbi:MAG: dockerin type I repeat-containing protein [Oscillospiraceae bacterium]|nr:dockerin type I repeat-containing protein [Oscillospiraceae bacterium]